MKAIKIANNVKTFKYNFNKYCSKAGTAGVLRNLAKLTGKHLCLSLYFKKIAELRPAALLKKRFWRRCFSVNFAKFLRTASDCLKESKNSDS